MRRVVRGVAALTLCVPVAAHAWAPLDSCRPTWGDLPSGYHVNEDGYARIPLANLRSILTASFAEWGRPCCSSWAARDLGLTSGVAEDGTDPQYIISFRASGWPSQLGSASSTLAVTLTTWSYDRSDDCVDLTADMVFNGANHTFGTAHSFSVVDLQAVATHEAGHWLGLGHSSVSTATMKPVYTSEEDRSLHADDEAGVCSLYPGSCGCSTDGDCGAGLECVAGSCAAPPCDSDADCAVGLVCNTGTGVCGVPPCRSDADCLGSQVCVSGACVAEFGCETCRPCTTSDDCGGEWQCASDGTTGFCTKLCETPSDCPGNSTCFSIEGESFNACLNDDAIEMGVCHAGYVCVDGLCDSVSCGAGQACDPATGRCVVVGGDDSCVVCDPCDTFEDCGGADCWGFDTGSYCAPTCARDADCPANTACVEFSDGGGGTVAICINADIDAAGLCPDGFRCAEAPVDPCAGVTCASGRVCDPETGACVRAGGDDVSPPDAGRDAATGDDVSPPEDAWTGPEPDPDAGVPDEIEGCGVCAPCGGGAACPDPALCVEIGEAGALCTIDCAAGPDVCPGGTGCFAIAIDGVSRSLCVNDDAATAGICPAPLECTGVGDVEDVGVRTFTMPGLGCAVGGRGDGGWLCGLVALVAFGGRAGGRARRRDKSKEVACG